MADARPTFVFDGDCGICRTWVDYWRQLTGDKVAYRPYQEAAADFPAIPAGEFKHAVQLIEPDGQVYSGAGATFRLLSYAPSKGAWWWLYRHVPGFAPLSEAAYRFISGHRGLLTYATHLLWGRTLEPARYDLVSALFLRGLGLIYLAAFVSLALQVRGLVGAQGILPLEEYLAAARAGWGTDAYWRLPSVFWLNASDAALMTGAVAGIALALLLTFGIAQRLALVGLVVLYLSFVYAGQMFFTLPVGHAAGRSGIPRHLSHRRLTHRRLAVPPAAVPLPVPRRPRQARFRRCDLAAAHRPRLSLLDAAAAFAARLLRGAAPALDALGGDRGGAGHRARRRGADLPAAPPAHARRRARHRLPDRHHAHRQL